MPDDLARWAAGRAAELVARAEAEAVAELKAALLAAAAGRAQPAPPAEPAPAPVPGHALWAYCVARASDTADDRWSGVHEDGAVAWIREGELALLTSRVPLAEFGEDPLRRNLNDIGWLERVARAHEAAIERALEQSTIVPLRLCTIFADAAAAARMPGERAAVFATALDALTAASSGP